MICPIVLCNHAKNWEDPYSHFEETPKNLKNGHLIPYNPGLRIFLVKLSSLRSRIKNISSKVI